ncbi:uncharacterized protein V6R79_007342 [Siganus canaliculatus]
MSVVWRLLCDAAGCREVAVPLLLMRSRGVVVVAVAVVAAAAVAGATRLSLYFLLLWHALRCCCDRELLKGLSRSVTSGFDFSELQRRCRKTLERGVLCQRKRLQRKRLQRKRLQRKRLQSGGSREAAAPERQRRWLQSGGGGGGSTLSVHLRTLNLQELEQMAAASLGSSRAAQRVATSSARLAADDYLSISVYQSWEHNGGGGGVRG